MKKKTVLYHSSVHDSRKGRIINALLAFITANRYSVIFHFKITLVRRTYQEHRLRQRVLDNLYVCLIFAPVVFGFLMFTKHCTPHPTPYHHEASDSTMQIPCNQDTLRMQIIPEAKAE